MTAPQKYLLAAGAGALLAVCLWASFKIGQKHPLKLDSTPLSTKVDTLYLHDTITAEKPVYLTKYVERVQLVPATDTVRLKDTLYVALEREAVEWRDDYAAVFASGIQPSVDSVRHFITEKVVTKEVTVEVPAKQKWKRIGWGVAAGPGVYWQPGMDNVTPGVGIVVGLRVNL